MGEAKGGWGAVAGVVPEDMEHGTGGSSSAQQKGPLGQTPGKGRKDHSTKSSQHCWLQAASSAPDSLVTGVMVPLTLLPTSETATVECWGAEPIGEIRERDFGETV